MSNVINNSDKYDFSNLADICSSLNQFGNEDATLLNIVKKLIIDKENELNEDKVK